MPENNPRNERVKSRMAPNENGLYETLQRVWQRHRGHAGDYIGLFILIIIYIVVRSFNDPFHSQFRLDDPRIQHPHAEVERVGVAWLFLYAGALPLLFVIAYIVIQQPSRHKAHVTLLGLIISVLLTTLLTDILKNVIGRPRPDLLARCKPEIGTPEHQMVSVDVCTEPDHHVLHDGWRSYPSGHSSFAFAGLGWLALLLASQTHVLRPRASLTVVLLSIAPLLVATLIAVSRLEDYRHDVFDVVSGAMLGFFSTYFNWRRYYPSLLSKDCAEPYPQLSSNAAGFQRVRDEEEASGPHMNERFTIGEE